MLRINVSEILAHDTCPQYWKYRYVEEMESPATLAMARGTYAHEVLKHMMAGAPPQAHPLFRARHSELGQVASTAAERAMDLALVEWWKRYGEEHPWDKVLSVERVLEVQVDTSVGPIIFYGTPDAVVEAYGKLWHVQHKSVTATRPVRSLIDYVSHSLHENLYPLLIQQEFPGVPYGGTLLSVVRELSEVRAIASPEALVHLEFIEVTPADITSATCDLELAVEQILLDHDRPRVYRNRASCHGKFGNSRCQFYENCWGGGEIIGE